MSDKVIADVSQYTRNVGRVPVDKLLERLESERKQLVSDKMRVEAQLAMIASEKTQKLADAYRRKMRREDACAATNQIQSDFSRARAPLMIEFAAIEERLHDVNRQIANKSRQSSNEGMEILRNIEHLLSEIFNRMCERQEIDNGK